MKNKSLILKIAIAISVGLTIFVNFLAVTLPINGISTGELSDAIPNYIVPAGYVFSIWSLIYLGLIAFGIYQFFMSKKEEMKLENTSYWILLSCLANSSWIFAWHYQKIGLSVLIMLVLLTSLIMVYRKLNIKFEKRTFVERLLIEVPFSIYLGWVSVATVVNIAAFLVVNNWNGFGIKEQIWSSIMITVVVILTYAMLKIRKDISYALVIIWALIGIGINHESEGIVLGSVITAVGVLLSLVLKMHLKKVISNKKFVLKI